MEHLSFPDQLLAAASSQGARPLRAQKAADVIRRNRSYRWVGIYEVERLDLALLAWSGFGDHHDALPAAEGLCGTAVRTATAVLAGSRSEIVVPILRQGTVVGILDVEAFPLPGLGATERAVLEGCASALAALWAEQRPVAFDPAEPASPTPPQS